jgi:site-specific recombinase XerD
LHLVDHGISPVSLNAAITGLKFFFEITIGDTERMGKMQPVRVPHTLPVILSREEVARLIAAAGKDRRFQRLMTMRFEKIFA